MSNKTKETELTIYARITNLNGLNQANSKEHHMQAELKNNNKGRIRVRKSSKNNTSNILQTIKTKLKDGLGLIETSVEIDEDFFKAFLSLCTEYMDKHRHIFETTNVSLTASNGKQIELPKLVYDVDVFVKDDGSYHEWCKIDVEIDSILDYCVDNNLDVSNTVLNIKVTHLPFKPIEAFIAENANEEQQQFIHKLFTECFLKPVKQVN